MLNRYKYGLVVGAIGASAYVALAAGIFPGFPIIGQPSYCASIVGSSGVATGVPGGGGGGVTGQGAPAGSPCSQTVAAGPAAITGSELIISDTGLPNGAVPQSVSIPSGLLIANGGTSNNANALIGSDFGQALWQRGTTPVSSGSANPSVMGPDGWYVYSPANLVTVSKQTGAADVPADALASARVQRVASQVGVGQICIGQLVPDADSQAFFGKYAIFSFDAISGANFSPPANNVNVTIAYHSAADVIVASATGNGTNTGTFASSVGSTQNITNYTEATPVASTAYTTAAATPNVAAVPLTTTWTRYSVAALIPSTIPSTTTNVLGIGVKICFTPSGTAGANDWFEFTKGKLEARQGAYTGNSTYIHLATADEWQHELARYYQITESGNTPIYANGFFTGTGVAMLMAQFPSEMRITPSTTPITVGGLKTMFGSTQETILSFSTSGIINTPRTAALYANSAGGTTGQGTVLVGTSSTGVLGFSAEP